MSAFLNFSQLNPIFGINLVENLLFWTDNRNQPRKINIERAVADNRYYQKEDIIHQNLLTLILTRATFKFFIFFD